MNTSRRATLFSRAAHVPGPTKGPGGSLRPRRSISGVSRMARQWNSTSISTQPLYTALPPPDGCNSARRRPSCAGENAMAKAAEHFDVLIVGAGLSGIGAGYHLQGKCPGKSYVILEGRDCIGGTWDLFRYPGVRSDSDMFTLGYSFKPWTDPKAIADGPHILNYVRETAIDNGIDRNIRFNHRVKRAAWSSQDARWTVEAERGGADGAEPEAVRFTCSFLFMCSGYYNYAGGYRPEFPGEQDFAGRIVHPQKWPEDLAYAGKRVVV